MYPNPVSGSLHLILGNPIQPVTITLTNIIGIEVINKVFSGTTQAELNVQDIPNGSYSLVARQGDDIYRQVVLVSH